MNFRSIKSFFYTLRYFFKNFLRWYHFLNHIVPPAWEVTTNSRLVSVMCHIETLVKPFPDSIQLDNDSAVTKLLKLYPIIFLFIGRNYGSNIFGFKLFSRFIYQKIVL